MATPPTLASLRALAPLHSHCHVYLPTETRARTGSSSFLCPQCTVKDDSSYPLSPAKCGAKRFSTTGLRRESCPGRRPAPSLQPPTTPGLPHLKDVLNDLLLIMESCLQLLHVELEQVQRGGACGGGREGGLAGGSFPRPRGGVEDRTKEWACREAGRGGSQATRGGAWLPYPAGPACWQSGHQC